jgi:uncharacterized protein YdaU (DUF1376 family)
MKLYIGDYLGDTQHLSTLQHGAYMLLIMAYWQRRGPLPSDDEQLARITRMTMDDWMQCKRITLAFFHECDGMLYHHRIDKELSERIEKSEKCKGAAGKRWEDRPPSNAKADASALREQSESIADDMPYHIHIPYSDSNPILEPQPEKEESVFASPRLQQNPENARDGCARIELARSLWNAKAPQIGPPCRLNALTFREDDRHDCLRIMSAYSDEDILQAIENYAQIQASPAFDVRSPYQSFAGFIRGGVEKFISEAEPFETFRIKPPAWQKPERGGALDDRPDATTPERIAQGNAEDAETAMSPEEYAAGLEAIQAKLRPKPALAKPDEAGVL